MTYFDNAATTFPKPASVRQAVSTAMVRYGANPGRSGHQMAEETARQVYAVREKAAALFGAGDTEWVVFTQNCTHALNIAIKGLVRNCDHVIISDLEHNSVLRPVHAFAENGVIRYTVAETFMDDPKRTVESFQREIRSDTRAIIVTHASNAFGCKLPVAMLGALAKQYGLYFIVDAAQTAGIEIIDMQKMQIDFLCMPGHKGLYGPSGTGILIAKDGAKLTPLTEGGTGSVSMDYMQPDFMPDRLESGTLNTAGIIGLGAGIDFVTRSGLRTLATHEIAITCRIWDGLAKTKGIRLYTNRPTLEGQVAVLSFTADSVAAEEISLRLSMLGFAVRGGLQCAPLAHKKFGTQQGGTVRISVGAFNSIDQADQLVGAIRRVLIEKSSAEKKSL